MNSLKTAIMALVAVAVTVGFLWYTNRPVAPVTATYEDVVAEAANGGYQLINTERLKKLYDEDPQGFLLVDARQEWEYRTGHIKGAVNFPMEPTWLSRWKKKDELENFLGPDKNRFLVFY